MEARKQRVGAGREASAVHGMWVLGAEEVGGLCRRAPMQGSQHPPTTHLLLVQHSSCALQHSCRHHLLRLPLLRGNARCSRLLLARRLLLGPGRWQRLGGALQPTLLLRCCRHGLRRRRIGTIIVVRRPAAASRAVLHAAAAAASGLLLLLAARLCRWSWRRCIAAALVAAV